MNALKTTALMFTGACLGLCLTASATSALQFHFQSPDGRTSVDLSFNPDRLIPRGTINSFPLYETPIAASVIQPIYPTAGLYSTFTPAILQLPNFGWEIRTTGITPWYSRPLVEYQWPLPIVFASASLSMTLQCPFDLPSCVGAFGQMRMYAYSSGLELYNGPIQLTSISEPLAPLPQPLPIPTPVTTPESPTSVPEPSTVLGLLLFGSWGLLKSRRI